jgi:hypothetical protein
MTRRPFLPTRLNVFREIRKAGRRDRGHRRGLQCRRP